ncbi:hypothetical protein [Roseicyclus mahoneyensis]|uniref:hypothetical protein n=1 Tax=Roseicyclus mahoneyensis TaxID=164332 RepID=UPI001B886BEB|nr:hypothetical protein [Roseicyclus mahoneyensis]
MNLTVAGATSLFVAFAAHEISVFGIHGYGIIGLANCPPSLCPQMAAVLTGLAAKSIGAGLALGLLGALLPMGPARLRAAATLWAVQYLWGLVGIASAYRSNFGTTWRWWEPMVELLWRPVLTPALLIVGLGMFLGVDRLLARQPRRTGS